MAGQVDSLLPHHIAEKGLIGCNADRWPCRSGKPTERLNRHSLLLWLLLPAVVAQSFVAQQNHERVKLPKHQMTAVAIKIYAFAHLEIIHQLMASVINQPSYNRNSTDSNCRWLDQSHAKEVCRRSPGEAGGGKGTDDLKVP